MPSRPPSLYGASQAVLAPGARSALERALRRWSEHRLVGSRVVDVGCGPRSHLEALGVQPIGVDRFCAAVQRFVARTKGSGVVADAAALPFRAGVFDSAWCFGLLHHLPDDAATGTIQELQRITKPSGQVVVFDGIRPTTPRRIAALVVRWLDRGAWMRSRPELQQLLSRVGTWQVEPICYAAFRLEGVVATGVARHPPPLHAAT